MDEEIPVNEKQTITNEQHQDKLKESKSKHDTKGEKNPQDISDDKLATKDCLLITEEQVDLDTSTDRTSKHEMEESEPIKQIEIKAKPKQKSDTTTTNVCWVSNVSKTIKANDLKKVFSSHGNSKVTTAKVMTNGKSYFGYVCLETKEMAEDCVKKLNNTRINGRRVVVSLQRPDLKIATPTVKKTGTDLKSSATSTKPEVFKKKILATSTSEKRNDNLKKSLSPKLKHSKSPNKENNSDIEASQLRRRLRALQSDLRDYKKRLSDFQGELRLKTERCVWLRKQLERADEENRVENRRLKLEREQFEKKQRLDEIRFEADKAMLNREIDECKKLREYLESKINELAQTRRRRSRSPTYGARRRSSPSAFRSPIRARMDKRSAGRYSTPREARSHRTPPPPPRLSSLMDKSDGRRSSHDTPKSYAISSKASSGQNARFVPSAAVVQCTETSNGRNSGAGSQALMDPQMWSTGYPIWRNISGGYSGGYSRGQQLGNNVFYTNFEKGSGQQESGNGKRY